MNFEIELKFYVVAEDWQVSKTMWGKLVNIGLNTCLQCGSFLTGGSLLCTKCEDQLDSSSLNEVFFRSEVREVVCFGLFRWQRDQNRILNRLSMALKGPRQGDAWRYYAGQFLNEWVKHESPRSAVLVPCPAVLGAKDHAFLFARALSDLTGIVLLPMLERFAVNEQKRMSRLERETMAGSRFRINKDAIEKFSTLRPAVIYFVDDIITTGATVAAAHAQLKKFAYVKAISLIIRE